MSRYNHFSNSKYLEVCFAEIPIGGKFRMDKFKGKIRRSDIVCIKTDRLSYEEFKSKKKYMLHSSAINVSSYSLKTITPKK